jgi:hypothetical protein
MLRSASIEPELPRTFDRRVIRRVQVQTVRESLSYWTPAIVGCVLAFIAIFSSLDLIAARKGYESIQLPAGEALRHHRYPQFELNEPIHLSR